MDEAERVLRSDKFGLSNKEMQTLIKPIFDIAEVVLPIEEINAIPRCPADNRVLECAIAGQCAVIVSGDRRDLLSLKHFRNINIVTARLFLEHI